MGSFAQPSSLIHRWKPPDPGTIKINVDASFHSGSSAVGVAARDENGSVQWFWCSKVVAGSAMVAELLAVLEAVLLAKDLGIPRVLFEGDNQSIMEALSQNLHSPNWVLVPILEKIQDALDVFEFCSFVWTPRLLNGLAHELCRWANQSEFSGYCIQRDLPPLVREKISADAEFE